tara:strand:+ start:1537 stop:2253 length:717 start_codon:yes stop_codon:yes gene_type:complete
MSLSIIIPCRNEAENIKNTISSIRNYIDNKINDYEILLINDFSTDKTLEVIKEVCSNNNNNKYFENSKPGLGGAINLAIDKAEKNFSVIVMADLSDSPEDIIKYYEEIKEKNLDAVFGTRFSNKSEVTNYPIGKLILNRIFNNIVRIIFWSNYNDFTNAFKIYKTNTLKEIKPIVSENFNIFLELPLKIISRKYNFSIIPIDWKNREKGKAKFNFGELGSKYLFTLLYCFLEKILLRK